MSNIADIFAALRDAVQAINNLNSTLSSVFPLTTLSGSATYDPPSLLPGDQDVTTVTVDGAAVGQFAVASFSQDLAGVQLVAYVSGDSTVSCIFRNGSAGAVDLGSGLLSVKVFG